MTYHSAPTIFLELKVSTSGEPSLRISDSKVLKGAHATIGYGVQARYK